LRATEIIELSENLICFLKLIHVLSVYSAPKRSLSVLEQRIPSPGSRERGGVRVVTRQGVLGPFRPTNPHPNPLPILGEGRKLFWMQAGYLLMV
jgi:hypothetical protein